MKILLASAAAAALCLAGAAQGAELLTNGTFDAGISGFYSEYNLAIEHNLYPEGAYDVITNPQADHNLFSAFPDHTPGADTGLMMVINGSGAADKIVWAEGDIGGGAPLIGAANTAFNFSFWVASVYPDSPANLQLWLNGAKVEGVNFAAQGGPEKLGVWQQFNYSGVTGEAGLRSIYLTNNNLEPQGNDFALDDLSLSGTTARSVGGVPEPASWGLMIMGFGAAGAVMRRRRAQLDNAATSHLA